MIKVAIWVCSLGVPMLTTGCGGGSVERTDLSGKVTFDGDPIVYGSVQLISKHADGVEAPDGSATIKDGQYDTTAFGGQGIVAGPYELRITAYPRKLPEAADETVEVATVEPLFIDYVMEADIEPPTFDIDVPAEAEGHNPYRRTHRSRNDP